MPPAKSKGFPQAKVGAVVLSVGFADKKETHAPKKNRTENNFNFIVKEMVIEKSFLNCFFEKVFEKAF